MALLNDDQIALLDHVAPDAAQGGGDESASAGDADSSQSPPPATAEASSAGASSDPVEGDAPAASPGDSGQGDPAPAASADSGQDDPAPAASADSGQGDPSVDTTGAAGQPSADGSGDDPSPVQQVLAAGDDLVANLGSGLDSAIGLTSGNQPPDILGLTRTTLQQEAVRRAMADNWIEDALVRHQLGINLLSDGKGSTVMLDGATVPTNVAVTRVSAEGQGAVSADVAVYITEDRVAELMAAALTAKLMPKVPGPPGQERTGPQNISMYLQYSFGPLTIHQPIDGGPSSTDQPSHSITAQVTAEFHAKDASGLEVSGTGTATWAADDKGGRLQQQSGFAGTQLAWVWSFLEGQLQVSPQFSAQVGVARGIDQASHTMRWMPTGQLGAGGQIQFQVPGTGGHLWVGIQGGPSVTVPQGGEATVDAGAQLTITFQR